MTRYFAWDPSNESREDAEVFDCDHEEQAATECAERDYNSGDTFDNVTIHVAEVDKPTVWAIGVVVEYDPTFTATTVEVQP